MYLLSTSLIYSTYNSDDDYSDYDNEYNWTYHDGDLLGEEWLDDEYHGIDTWDLIDVNG